MAVEEIRGITWELDGEELKPWLAAQRLYKAGFKDAKVLAIMWATIEAESGGYLKAWHHNVTRNEDGTIKRTADGRMEVRSTDLGFIQRNVPHSPFVLLPTTGDESKLFVEELFTANPDLARADKSSEIAFQLWKQRGFQPWYAYTNGHYKKSMDRACLAVANFLALANGLRPIPFAKRVEV